MKLSDWHHQRPPSIAFGLRGSGASSATAPAAPQTVFTSLNQLAGSAIPSVGVDSVRTEGFNAAGDGGGALYRRAATEPPHAGKIRSADGAWWEYIPDKIGWNIRTFGALGDGVTDDNPSISAALSTAAFFAGSHCQQTVYVPQSDSAYIFTTISVGSYVELLGLGGVLRLRDNVCVDEDTFYYPINNLGQSNTTFRNLRIDGNGGANTLFRVADAITCVGRNSSVLDCVIDDAPDSGITFSQTPGGICRGNIIDGASDAGIYVNDSNESDPSTDGTIISECTVRNAAVAGYSIKRSSAAMTLTNCTAARCGNGVTVEDFGVGNGGAPAELVIANIVLRDIGYTHRATNIAERGLSLTFCDHVTVTGVTAVNVSGIGLYLSGAKNCAVSGCSLAG
ncbi:MAG: right-handed parallel beta-helix repeat-containing protein, partial [Pseudomonadota bacterium]